MLKRMMEKPYTHEEAYEAGKWFDNIYLNHFFFLSAFNIFINSFWVSFIFYSSVFSSF